ncbi:MAG: 3'-5' exoribonuclease [Pyrinomonadaceae bacterium]
MVEIYVSTDVETDGPIPGPHSMLSLGSAAYFADKTLVATFTVNLETLPGAAGHPETMEWWRKEQPRAWEACRRDVQPPEQAMRDYVEWLKSLPGTPVFVGYPAAFDFMFVCWYLNKFAGENPFNWWALDIKTFAMALLNVGFLDAFKRNMPRHWFDDLPYTHQALDDALSQGALFCNMLAEHKKMKSEEALRLEEALRDGEMI